MKVIKINNITNFLSILIIMLLKQIMESHFKKIEILCGNQHIIHQIFGKKKV